MEDFLDEAMAIMHEQLAKGLRVRSRIQKAEAELFGLVAEKAPADKIEAQRIVVTEMLMSALDISLADITQLVDALPPSLRPKIAGLYRKGTGL